MPPNFGLWLHHVKDFKAENERNSFCLHYFSREMALSKTFFFGSNGSIFFTRKPALIALPNYLISLPCYLSTTSLFLL